MATRFRDFKVSEYWNLAWPFAVLVILGIAAQIVWHWFPRHIIEAIGEALIIAGLLGLTFELFATRWLIERVALDVAGRLAGAALPSELQMLVRDVVGTHIVREDYIKSYRFSEPDDHGYVFIDVTMKFIAKNYSSRTEPYSPSIQEETFYSPEFKYIEYGITGEDSRVLTEDQILTMTKVDTATQVKTFIAPAVDLVPISTDNKAQCSVMLKYRMKMREEYSDVTNFGGATLGATIELDEIPETLTFVSGGDDKVRHTPESRIWHFQRPFITGQHIRAWWFRKNRTQVQRG